MIDFIAPSMAEVEALPWNGLNACSTFSGAGGSCLGYRMAGYRLLWANEFVEAAQQTYKANHPRSFLDTRDIRTVKGREVLERIGLDVGQLDVLDGSPPCSAFSQAGSRSAGWGEVRKYSDTTQRVDDLFFEYARLVEEIRPRAFIAENVPGLARGSGKGYLLRILARLRSIGYRVQAKILDASWLGVVQARQRLIFIGFRNDLETTATYPRPLERRGRLIDACPWLEKPGMVNPFPVEKKTDMRGYSVGKKVLLLKPGEQAHRPFQLSRTHPYRSTWTVTAQGTKNHTAGLCPPWGCRKFSLAELRRLFSFPDDFVLPGDDFEKSAERIARAVPPIMMSHIARAVAKTLHEVDE